MGDGDLWGTLVTLAGGVITVLCAVSAYLYFDGKKKDKIIYRLQEEKAELIRRAYRLLAEGAGHDTRPIDL